MSSQQPSSFVPSAGAAVAEPAVVESIVAAPARRLPGVSLARWDRLDVALLLGIGVLALALRLPYLQLIPALTDETAEIYRGFLITQGGDSPLTAGTSYKGALWTWLVAGAFWLTGNSLYAPRGLILAIGVLTVLATYGLGRAWGGRVGGVVAAALLTTASAHIVVNSHVAWGSCATPLFTTLAVWTLHGAVRGSSLTPAAAMPLAGLFGGLALQTHPVVLALLPGAAIFLLWRGRSLLRTPWPYLATTLVFLTNLNLIVFNVATGFRSIAESFEHSEHYTGGQALTAAVYVRRLGLLLQGVLQSLGGTLDLHSRAGDLLLNPAVWPIAALAVAGLLWQWRRGNPLPALLVAGSVLILPLFNDKFTMVLNGRYLAPLLPILFAAAGSAVAAGIACHGGRAELDRGATWRRLGPVAVGLVVTALVLQPLLSLRAYYAREYAAGRTNVAIFNVLDQLDANRHEGEPVVVMRPPREFHLGEGNGLASEAFRLALGLAAIPNSVTDHDDPALRDPSARCRDQMVILVSREERGQRDVAGRLGRSGVDLRPVGPAGPAGAYGLYRLPKRPDAQAC